MSPTRSRCPRARWSAWSCSLLANRALLLVLGAVVLSAFSGTMFSKNLLYYFKYVVGDAKLGGAALAVGALTAAICVPAFAVIVRLVGKRGGLADRRGSRAWRD